jgi:hypothetical protein
MAEQHTMSSWACALLAAFSAAAALCDPQPAPNGAAPSGTAPSGTEPSGGIWKAAVPAKPMNGEFDSLDPLGVAAGARIKADCSLNWIDPDDGKLYCFSSGTSLEFFLDKPQATLERARTSWRNMHSRDVESPARGPDKTGDAP